MASQLRDGLAQLVSEAGGAGGGADARGPARGQHLQLPEGAGEPDDVRLGLAVREHLGRRRTVSGRGPPRGHTHRHGHKHAHTETRAHAWTHTRTDTRHRQEAQRRAEDTGRGRGRGLRPSGLSSSWRSWARETARSPACTRRRPPSRLSAAPSAPQPVASAAADAPISSLQIPGRTGSAAPGHRAPAVPAEPGGAETAASVPPPARRWHQGPGAGDTCRGAWPAVHPARAHSQTPRRTRRRRDQSPSVTSPSAAPSTAVRTGCPPRAPSRTPDGGPCGRHRSPGTWLLTHPCTDTQPPALGFPLVRQGHARAFLCTHTPSMPEPAPCTLARSRARTRLPRLNLRPAGPELTAQRASRLPTSPRRQKLPGADLRKGLARGRGGRARTHVHKNTWRETYPRTARNASCESGQPGRHANSQKPVCSSPSSGS